MTTYLLLKKKVEALPDCLLNLLMFELFILQIS